MTEGVREKDNYINVLLTNNSSTLMKFGPKEKMRSLMCSNYPYGQISKNSFLSSHNEFRSI